MTIIIQTTRAVDSHNDKGMYRRLAHNETIVVFAASLVFKRRSWLVRVRVSSCVVHLHKYVLIDIFKYVVFVAGWDELRRFVASRNDAYLGHDLN